MNESGFRSWVFHSNMLYGAKNKWWGDYGNRDFPHEGLDFCLFKDVSGRVLGVDENTEVPVILDGRVRAIFNDYLGKAIIVSHHFSGENQPEFLSVYAHTKPFSNLAVGDRIIKNENIATVAGFGQKKNKILPHLHLTFGWATKAMTYKNFEWNRLREPDLIRLIDPLTFLHLSYNVITN